MTNDQRCPSCGSARSYELTYDELGERDDRITDCKCIYCGKSLVTLFEFDGATQWFACEDCNYAVKAED